MCVVDAFWFISKDISVTSTPPKSIMPSTGTACPASTVTTPPLRLKPALADTGDTEKLE